jgi:hypothetical protein
MTHIEQLHLEAIQKDKEIRKYLCENDFGTSKLEIIVAKKSAHVHGKHYGLLGQHNDTVGNSAGPLRRQTNGSEHGEGACIGIRI